MGNITQLIKMCYFEKNKYMQAYSKEYLLFEFTHGTQSFKHNTTHH